jgi:hypothetical protein
MTLIILKKSQDVKVLISAKHKYPGIGCEHSYDDDDPVYYAKNRLNYQQKVYFGAKRRKDHLV